MSTLRTSFLLLAISALLGAPACTLATTSSDEGVELLDETEPEQPPIENGDSSQPPGPGETKGIITGNGASPLTPELVNLWAPAARKLTLGPLTSTTLGLTDLLNVTGGRTFLDYLVKCALADGQSMTTSFLGIKHTFKGHVGLAPEWQTSALSESSRHWVSACVLAHVNSTGKTVELLLRGDHPVLAVPEGASTGPYTLREGAFYGDIFNLIPEKYACAGVGTIEDRKCTQSTAGLSPCGFVVPGECRGAINVCEDVTNGAYETCHSKQIAAQDTSMAFPETLTVYLKPEGDSQAD